MISNEFYRSTSRGLRSLLGLKIYLKGTFSPRIFMVVQLPIKKSKRGKQTQKNFKLTLQIHNGAVK